MRLAPLGLASLALAFPATAEARRCPGSQEGEHIRTVGVTCKEANRVLNRFNDGPGAPDGWSCSTARFQSELGDRTRCRNGRLRIVDTTPYAPD